MVWFFLLIPLITVLFLAKFFVHKMAIWEYFLVFCVPLIAILIGKYTTESMQVTDKEYWNSYVVSATYYEEWDEWDNETCTREDCSGSGEDRTCVTETYDCSHRDYHGPIWSVTDDQGHTYGISDEYFEDLCRLWGSRIYEDMNRDYYRIDGNVYHTSYDNKFEHTIPLCVMHSYVNKVQASRSVFNFQEVDTASIKQYGLFKFPLTKDDFDFNPILGINNPDASKKLQIYNALNGKRKELHMLILVFKNQPYDAAVLQESYWKGGNKNEFTLCLGVKGSLIDWTKVISWTEVEDLKIRVARQVKEMRTFDIIKIVDYMGKEVPDHFKRKRFRDFNYLTVEPSNTALIIILIVTILTTIGMSLISVLNGVDREE